MQITLAMICVPVQSDYIGLLARVEWLRDTMPKTNDDLNRWAVYPIYPVTDSVVVEFMREEDAILFILRWQR